MSVIVRRLASVPVRSAGQTWHAFVELVSEPGTAAWTTLESIAGVGSMIIAEEYTGASPIVVMPAAGPRVRVYTLHNDHALGDDIDETKLASGPLLEVGWSISLPSGADDLALAQAAVAKVTGVTVRDIATEDGEHEAPERLAAARHVTINLDELSR